MGNCETATAMPKRAFLEDSLMLTKQLFPLPAGTVFLRDVRVVHGGCPNNSDSHRWMPSFSFLSHAYLKEMNWLNEHWVFGKIADVHPQNIWKNSVRKIRKEYHYVDGRLLRWSDRWPDERCLYGCQPKTKPANIQYNLSREQTGNDFTLSDVIMPGADSVSGILSIFVCKTRDGKRKTRSEKTRSGHSDAALPLFAHLSGSCFLGVVVSGVTC